jgi:hypothetical protein
LIEQRISALKELLQQEIESARRAADADEKRIDLRHEAMRTEVEQRVIGAMDFCSSQFKQIETQLQRFEALRIEQKADTKAAVDAALTAQKEAVREQSESFALAVAKSEAATNKQIEQLTLTASTARDDLRRGIDDAKERITDAERTLNVRLGEVDAKANAVVSEKRGATDYRVGLYAAIAIGLAIAAFLAGRGG